LDSVLENSIENKNKIDNSTIDNCTSNSPMNVKCGNESIDDDDFSIHGIYYYNSDDCKPIVELVEQKEARKKTTKEILSDAVKKNSKRFEDSVSDSDENAQDAECEHSDSDSDTECDSDSDKKDKQLNNISNHSPDDLIAYKIISQIEISCFLSQELLNLVSQHNISIPEIFTSIEHNSSSKKNISYINYDKLFKPFVHIVATDVQTKIIPTDNNASAPTPVLRTNLITIINESAELKLFKIVLPLRLCKLFGALKESYEAFYGKSKKRTRTGSDKMEKQEITCLPSTDQFGKRKENKMTKKSIKTNTRQVCSI
jgi:hypothetical protein